MDPSISKKGFLEASIRLMNNMEYFPLLSKAGAIVVATLSVPPLRVICPEKKATFISFIPSVLSLSIFNIYYCIMNIKRIHDLRLRSHALKQAWSMFTTLISIINYFIEEIKWFK